MLNLCEYCTACTETETKFECPIHEDTSECDSDFEFNVNKLF
jgi:hypothetical protein